MPLQLAILVSGRGSNLRAILDAIKEERLDAQVGIVISNDPEAPALEVASEYGVATKGIAHKGLSRSQHEEAVAAELAAHAIDFVVLAGYMRILSPQFLHRFKDPAGYFKVINIHPSMLPAFPGKNAYEDAFENNASESGITIHLVDELVDHGPILAQEKFIRLPDDTIDTFKARGLALEHVLYPRVLQNIAKNGIKVLLKESVER